MIQQSTSGVVVFFVGLVASVVGLALGEMIAPAVDEVGLVVWFSAAGLGGKLALWAFVASFPIGALVMMAGASLSPGRSRAGLMVVAVTASLVGAVYGLVPAIFGIDMTPLYFGVGGCLVLALFAAVVWLWGRRRTTLAPNQRLAADITMAGYVALACAAWQTCGLGGMPSYGLHPVKMISFGSLPIAVIVLKQVMALLVVGWGLTALGQWLARDASSPGENG